MYSEEFAERCQKVFDEEDKDGSGYLNGEELHRCVLRCMPPETAEMIEEEGGKGVTTYDRSMAELINAFCLFNHEAHCIRNFCIEIGQISDFVRFCLAWRLYAYFSNPKIKKKNMKRPKVDVVFVG